MAQDKPQDVPFQSGTDWVRRGAIAINWLLKKAGLFASDVRAQVEDALVAGTNITITPSGTGETRELTLAATGVPPALSLWDYWQETWIGTANIASPQGWLGVAIASGTNDTGIPTASVLGYNRIGVFIRSSTTANGGFRYQTVSTIADYFGVLSHKFRCAFLWRTDFTNRLVRLGYLDTTTHADATDGAYFEISGSTASAKTANNGTRTTHGTTATLSLDVPYIFDVEVNAAGTSARFRIYQAQTEAAIYDQTITTNIPTTSARTFGHGFIATESSTTASDIGMLYMLSEGTIAGYQRARGGT